MPKNAANPGEFTLSSPVRSFVRTTVRVMARPKSYFRSIDPRGGFAAPLVFALVCSAVSAPLGALLLSLIHI